jgi:UDP-N-acetylmuramate dehydrogenase
MKTTTSAEYYFEAESKEDLQNAAMATRKLNIPLFLLGGGSNTAVTKPLIKGLVVRNLYQFKKLVNETDEYVDLLISSGYSIGRLVNETAAAGYEGLEYHLGLPGSLGGGVAMNSKWYVDRKPVYIGDPLVTATLIDKDGNLKEVDRDYFKFSYDYSILKDTKEIFVEGIFRFKKNDPEVLKQRAREANEFRKKTQVIGQPTCGCMFQNISEEEKNHRGLPTTSAGYLIDKSGLKNTQIGDFVVSEKHANFFVNKGKGKPEDLLKLIQLVKTKVKETFGVDLKEEVLIV